MTLKTFDPRELSVVLGVTPITGFENGSAITIEVEDSTYNETRDIHGNITRFKVNNKSATITLYLTQSSSSNASLSSYVEADRINDAGIFPVMIKDQNGDSLFSATKAYIMQMPKIDYGNENKSREWTIRANDISSFIGGVK